MAEKRDHKKILKYTVDIEISSTMISDMKEINTKSAVAEVSNLMHLYEGRKIKSDVSEEDAYLTFGFDNLDNAKKARSIINQLSAASEVNTELTYEKLIRETRKDRSAFAYYDICAPVADKDF